MTRQIHPQSTRQTTQTGPAKVFQYVILIFEIFVCRFVCKYHKNREMSLEDRYILDTGSDKRQHDQTNILWTRQML